jgi:type I restriction enzyme M protein
MLGWTVKNPSRHVDGQVYTKNECLTHWEIKKALGQETPENVVKISETKYWIIEAKRDHKDLQKALDEAKYYADKINKSSNQILAVIATGVAGNSTDTFLIKSEYFDGSDFNVITINGQESTGLFNEDETELLISQNNANLADVVIDRRLFEQKAETINEILHLGAINKDERARVMAALLLSLLGKTPPNIDDDPDVLIRDINGRVEHVLAKEGKLEFKDLIKISLPPSRDNHFKFKKALVDTIQELNILKIRSAMNSGTDVLGEFYEVFLKYGNGAKEMGIVLTPRHITKFAANVLNVTINDIVYDLTCGTGGFLVSAFDYAKKDANEDQINKFKQNNLFGVEQDSKVLSLAIVNMIFRGDGKNNIVEGDCFQKYLVSSVSTEGDPTAIFVKSKPENHRRPVTKVLMNPPFATKKTAQKEYRFVDHALDQMQNGGLLFSVLPYSIMVKAKQFQRWRQNLLTNNTLLAVVTFPPTLFYPIGVVTLGVFIKKGIPHPKEQNVLWIRAINDGFAINKGKRRFVVKLPNDLETIRTMLKSFIVDQNTRVENIKKFVRV